VGETGPMNTKELAAELQRREKKEGSTGAVPNSPKGQLFDASDVKAKKTDKHLRWVNLKNPDKVTTRIAEGYRRVADSEDGRHLGTDYALFEMSKEQYETRLAAKEERDRQRQNAYKSEFEAVVEAVAKDLRDNHGISITSKQLMDVREKGE